MDLEKKGQAKGFELVLSLCSGLRNVPVKTAEDIAYNNALGDIYDCLITDYADCLFPGTVSMGKWVRDKAPEKENAEVDVMDNFNNTGSGKTEG